MEQWIVDGRDAIVNRTFSLIPKTAEEEGYTEDLTSGLRGILKKVVVKKDIDPEHDYTPEGKPTNQTECLVKVAYFHEGKLADVSGYSKEELAGAGSEWKGMIQSEVGEWDDNPDVIEKLVVVVGAGQVAQGLEESLMSMVQGEQSAFYLDPSFGFRGDGFPRPSIPGCVGIPPNVPIKILVELVAFEHHPSDEERIVRGERVKGVANKLFQGGDVMAAIHKYHAAFDKLGSKRWKYPGTDEDWRRRDVLLRSSLYANLAACWAKREHHIKTVEFCNKALEVNPQHVKARFRRAQVAEARVEFESAAADLQYLLDSKLVNLTPAEKQDVESTLARIHLKNKTQTKAQNDAYKRMFWSTTSEGQEDQAQGEQPNAAAAGPAAASGDESTAAADKPTA